MQHDMPLREVAPVIYRPATRPRTERPAAGKRRIGTGPFTTGRRSARRGAAGAGAGAGGARLP